MMNYSRKYFYRYAIVISLLAALFFSLLIINHYVAKYKGKIEQDLCKQFNQQILIGSLSYWPPNFIILKDVSIAGYGLAKESVSFSIQKVKLAISLSVFLDKKRFLINEIYLAKPAIYFPNIPKINLIEYSLAVCADIKQFIMFFNPLVDPNIVKFSMKGGHLILPKSAYPLTNVDINSLEIKRGGSILGNGSILIAGFSPAANVVNTGNRGAVGSFDYRFKGRFGQKGIAIDDLMFKKENFYAKFWGAIDRDVLRLKGFAFLGKFSSYLASNIYSGFSPIGKFKNLLKPFTKPESGILWLSSFGRLSIYDFDCMVKFNTTDIKIENLSFYVNGNPVFLKGNISFLEKILVNLNLIFYPNSANSNLPANLNKFEAGLIGELWKGAFGGKFNFVFPRKIKGKILHEKVEADFKGLIIYLAENKHIKILFNEGVFDYISARNSHKIPLSEFKGALNYKDKKLQLIFISSLYGGLLNGHGLVDIAHMPFRNNLDLIMKGVDVNGLGSFLAYLASFSGKAAARISARNHPDFNLNGNIIINTGAVENLKFLQWLEDFFGVDAFKKMGFSKLSAQFLITDKISELRAIKLDSEKFGLRGDFSSHENGLSSGKFFLSISQELLENSDKFKPLLGLLGKDVPVIDFDFQLSGISESMNFQWLDSDFKKRIQQRLPGFVERGIERKVEEAIISISTK